MSWYYSDNEERWSGSNGPHTTKELAIEAGRNEYDECCQFWIGQQKHIDQPWLASGSAKLLAEWMRDRLWEKVGEAVDGNMDPSGEAEAELDYLIASWLQRWNLPTCWAVENIEEVLSR